MLRRAGQLVKNALSSASFFGTIVSSSQSANLSTRQPKTSVQCFYTAKSMNESFCFYSGLRKYSSEAEFDAAPPHFPSIQIPATVNELQKLNHEEVIRLLQDTIFLRKPSALTAIKKPFDSKLNDYPFNALDGSHLHLAIEAYKRNLDSNGTVETAMQAMISILMEEDKVTVKSLARTIAIWLEDYTKDLKYFFATILRIDLNSVQSSISELIANSSKGLIYSFGYDFHFVGRKQSVKQIEDCFATYLSVLQQKATLDKQDFQIPFIAAAPGVGKSKLLKEIAELEWKNGYFPIYVSFGNGTKRESKENDIAPETSLSLRILYSLFRALDNDLLFPKFVDQWKQYFGTRTIDISTTLDFLNSVLLKLFNNEIGSQKLRFFIAVDEVHQIDSGTPDLLNPLRAVLSHIGSYMQHATLLPLFAGTYYSVILKNFYGSTFRSQFIPLEAFLSNDEQIALIQSLSKKRDRAQQIMYPKLENWRTQHEFRHYLRLFGGYPRGIEYFLREYLDNNKMIDPHTSWSIASQGLSLPTSNIQLFLQTIVVKVVTQQVIVKTSTVIDSCTDMTTWSDLENRGVVILSPIVGSNTDATVNYPPVLLDKLLSVLNNYDLLINFRNFFLQPTKIFWQNWEDIVHAYAYMIFSLLMNQQNLILKQLFPFAKMNSKTAKFMLSKIPSTCLMLESEKRLDGEISKTQDLLEMNVENTSMQKFETEVNLLTKDSVFVVKNASGASAGDVLVFGLTNGNDQLVFHYQCRWSDKQDGNVTFSQIKQELEKNDKFKIEDAKLLNITVVMTGDTIYGLEEDLPNNLIIICKENFNQFFGTLSDAMKSACAHQYIRINELDKKGLQSFVGIGASVAETIIDKRGKEGYINTEDLKTKLHGSLALRYLMYGNNVAKDSAQARTILL